jgi:protein-disulfide isomerase
VPGTDAVSAHPVRLITRFDLAFDLNICVVVDQNSKEAKYPMTKSVYVAVVCCLPLCVFAFAQNSSTPLAEVNGVKLTLGDFEQKSSAPLFQARNVYYEAQRKALDEFVNQYLLEARALRENVSVEELLQRHVLNTIAKDPTEESLRVYYEGVETNQPFEAVRDKILDHLRQSRIAKAKANYLQSLRSQAHVALMLAPPRLNISLENAPVLGPRNAPVTLIEYGDFECAYCQQVYPELKKLEAAYNGKLAVVFKDLPLPMHPQAQKAAEAAHCAGSQGKYWEYHDLLFSSKRLDIPALKEQALALHLDNAGFNKCLDSGEQAAAVKTQALEGQKFGLSGTPSFFINGRFLTGAIGYEAFRAVVDEELEAAATRSVGTR